MGAIDLPSNVRAAVDTTANIGAWWAVAGGWAIDMWLGRQTRDHHDIEVAVLRDDRIVIWEQLHDRFELTCIDPPDSGWRAWGPDELVAGPAFQGQACGPDATFDLFFETASDGRWIFRRDARITRPLGQITVEACGLPIIRPEVQLLYMAKSSEPKNELDFANVAPTLASNSRAWLSDVLRIVHPEHRWIESLDR